MVNFKSRWNLQDRLIPVGEYYNLPMISIKDAVAPELDKVGGVITDNEYFSDDYHPTDKGHTIMSDCITNFFKAVDSEQKKDSDIAINSTPKIGNSFVGVKMLDSASKVSEITVNTGSFNEKDDALASFAYD